MRYIALLRGVNVGGKNTVPMKELKACFEEAGFTRVKTYINSGNILFDSDQTDVLQLAQQCEALILTRFDFPVRLALLDADTLKDAWEHAPAWWGTRPDAKHNAIFVIPPATGEEVAAAVGAINPQYEQIAVYGTVLFWTAAVEGFSRTRWSKIVGTQAYQWVTIRNANTMKKLVELAFA